LASNARDAMPEGGTLTLATRAATAVPGRPAADGTPEGYVLLSVVDTGEGMDAATSNLAFEPFFTTKARGKGTGVGLTAVRELVQSMGGLMRMESEPGRGTTVSIFLQCVAAPA
jgi:signal transduction histidine kinase